VEDRLDELFVLPGEAAKKNGNPVPFFRSKRSLFGLLEMARRREAGLPAQSGAFGSESLSNLILLVDDDETTARFWHLSLLSNVNML
jgi:hypothetical protein